MPKHRPSWLIWHLSVRYSISWVLDSSGLNRLASLPQQTIGPLYTRYYRLSLHNFQYSSRVIRWCVLRSILFGFQLLHLHRDIVKSGVDLACLVYSCVRRLIGVEAIMRLRNSSVSIAVIFERRNTTMCSLVILRSTMLSLSPCLAV